MPRLVIETADLVDSARLLSEQVGEPLWSVVGDAEYESCAPRAARAGQDALNAIFALSTLLGATADNYARADLASTAGVRHTVTGLVAQLPPLTSVTVGARFVGVGGGAPNAPFGWSYVEQAVGAAWPNGHQDRLRRAAAAWRRSAQALSGRVFAVESAVLAPLRDGLPECADIRTACWTLARHLDDVARAHRGLAQACAEFADRLDRAHSDVKHELLDLTAQSITIQIAGGVVAAFTFGAAEVPAQGLEAWRVEVAAAKIIELLDQFANDVRELVSALPLVGEISTRVSTALDDLLSIRLVSAQVAGVPGLRVLQVTRDGRPVVDAAGAGAEAAAVGHLVESADLPSALRAATESDRAGQWNKMKTLTNHFARHGADFGSPTRSDYLTQAGDFFRRGVREHLPTKIDEDGNILIYDPQSNTFGVYTSDGTTRTFFKPDVPDYFEHERGTVVR